MAANASPPLSMMVVQARFGIARRFFRLTIASRELVFVAAGGTWSTRKRIKQLDAKPFDEQRADHPDSFTLLVDDIESARLVRPSFWSRFLYHFNPVALLVVQPVAGQQLMQALPTGCDALAAATALRKTLGPRFSVETDVPTGYPSFECNGQTVLMYDPAHGNQIEFLDLDGRCYLWYPGNMSLVTGRWRIDDEDILFRYGWETYNPVTSTRGGGWEPVPLDDWVEGIVDMHPGDVCRLASLGIPGILRAQPPFDSLLEAF